MGLKNYDPGKVVLTFKGITVTGFHSGTFITVERDDDTWKKDKGAQGDGVRTRNRNKGGKITFTTQGTSPSNDLLMAAIIADETTGIGYGVASVVDLNGTSKALAAEAWVLKPANLEFADEHTPREWVIDCNEVQLFVGGSIL